MNRENSAFGCFPLRLSYATIGPRHAPAGPASAFDGVESPAPTGGARRTARQICGAGGPRRPTVGWGRGRGGCRGHDGLVAIDAPGPDRVRATPRMGAPARPARADRSGSAAIWVRR